jgi:hypothetical protein
LIIGLADPVKVVGVYSLRSPQVVPAAHPLIPSQLVPVTLKAPPLQRATVFACPLGNAFNVDIARAKVCFGVVVESPSFASLPATQLDDAFVPQSQK